MWPVYSFRRFQHLELPGIKQISMLLLVYGQLLQLLVILKVGHKLGAFGLLLFLWLKSKEIVMRSFILLRFWWGLMPFLLIFCRRFLFWVLRFLWILWFFSWLKICSWMLLLFFSWLLIKFILKLVILLLLIGWINYFTFCFFNNLLFIIIVIFIFFIFCNFSNFIDYLD